MLGCALLFYIFKNRSERSDMLLLEDHDYPFFDEVKLKNLIISVLIPTIPILGTCIIPLDGLTIGYNGNIIGF